MNQNGYVSVFLRTVVNDVGLHYIPGPSLEARCKSDQDIKLQFVDLSDGKSPISFAVEPRWVEFRVRKNKYPSSSKDVILELNSARGLGYLDSPEGELEISLYSDDLKVASEYYYELVIAPYTIHPENGREPVYNKQVRTIKGAFSVKE